MQNRLYQLPLKNLLNLSNPRADKGLAVDDDKRPLTATVHTARTLKYHLVIKMILPEIVTDNLHYLPVAPGKTGAAQADLYVV